VDGLSQNRFIYHWQADRSVSGAEYASYVNKPLAIDVTGAPVTADNDASQTLYTRYGILLVDDDAPWSREHATRLLETLDRLPRLETDPYKSLLTVTGGKISRWSLTDAALVDDVAVVEGDYKNGRVRISKAAFTYAAPLIATVEGKRGSFFSNRLFRAAARFATADGTDLAAVKVLMQERYGVKVAIDANFEPSEFLALIAMLEEFPEGFRDLSFPSGAGGLRYILRRVDGYAPPNNVPAIAWTASGYIEFMPNGLMADTARVHRLVVHEKGHFIWRYLISGALRREWLAQSGWYRTGTNGDCATWTRDRAAWSSSISIADLDGANMDIHVDAGEAFTSATDGTWASCATTEFVSAYAGELNPNEDFAESVAYFLTNPDLLRSRALPKYEFIRDRVMQGVIYLSVIRPDLTFEVLNLYPDYVYPGKINRVDIEAAGAPTADKQLTVTLGVALADCGAAANASCLSSVSSAYARIHSTRGTYVDMYMTATSAGTVTGSITIPKGAAAGWWAPRAITLFDAVGNQRIQKVSNDDFGWKLYIDNPEEDLVAPAYIARSLTTAILHPGDAGASSDLLADEQEIRVAWRVRENISMDGGYCFTRFAYEANYGTQSPTFRDTYGLGNAGGYTAFSTAQADGATGACDVRVRATRFFPSGSWYPGTVSMRDRALNDSSTFFADNHAIYEPVVKVNVVSAASDIIAPTADVGVCASGSLSERCLRIQATPTQSANPNGETEVLLYYWAYENQGLANASGFEEASITLRNPQGQEFQFYHSDGLNSVAGRSPQRTRYFVCPEGTTCDAATPIQYVFRTVLPPGSAPGLWGLTQLIVWDKARNQRIYGFTETIRFTVGN
jgi:hypothetical protein